MTLVIIEHCSKEEREAYFASLTEEQKKECLIVENYNLEEEWNKWEKVKDQFPLKKYLLFKSELFQEPDASFIFLVDILKTANVMQENYETFRKIVGFDFHPLEVVLEMPNKDSQFWITIKNNNSAILWGILFGYGAENAFQFHWKHFSHPSSCDPFCNALTYTFSEEKPRGSITYSIENLGIPTFAVFNEPNKVVQQYEQERTNIQKIYQGRDFLDLTLQRLTRK